MDFAAAKNVKFGQRSKLQMRIALRSFTQKFPSLFRSMLVMGLLVATGDLFGQIYPISVRFENGCEAVKAYFQNEQPALSQTWDFGDGTTSSALAPIHEFPYGSILSVSLTIENNDGTFNTWVLDVNTPEMEDPADLVFPNIFTPNGDGINDVFGPITDRILGPCSQIQIFNRFGERVHFGDRYNLQWDGRTTAGEKAVPGTYFYIFTINGVERTGTLSLHQ